MATRAPSWCAASAAVSAALPAPTAMTSGRRAGAAGAQGGDDRLLGTAAQGEDQEGIGVEAFAEEVVDGRDMLAGIGVVGAGAVGHEVGGLAGEEAAAGGGKDLLDLLG